MSLGKLALAGVALVVALIVTAVAGWWFLIRGDAELATEAPEIPEDLIRATRTPSQEGPEDDADVLTYRIIPESSEAAYFADEQFASLPLPSTAKGVTNEIEGEFYLTPDGIALSSERTSIFTVDLRNLTSDEARRDDRVQQALETSSYPTATFTVSEATGYDPAIAEGEEQTLLLSGTLDLHGVQRDVTWETKARAEGDVITALATVTIRYDDFGITAPSIGGFVTVEDDVTLQVQIVAQAA